MSSGGRVALVELQSWTSSRIQPLSPQCAARLAAIIVVLTALSAMASIWFAEASGELVSAIAFLQLPSLVVSP